MTLNKDKTPALLVFTSETLPSNESEKEVDFLVTTPYTTFELYKDSKEYVTEITTIGSCEPSATERERIAYFMSVNLPSKFYLQIVDNYDQIIEWVKAKDYWCRIASCFLEEIDNPIIWDLENDLITQGEYDLIILETQYYNLWELLNTRWEIIYEIRKVMFDECKFNKPREILQEILFDSGDNNYLKCFHPHFIQNVRELRILATLRRKDIQGKTLTTNEIRNLRNLEDKYLTTSLWLERLIAVCEIGKKYDPFIETKYKIYNVILEGILKIQEHEMCKNNSFTWVNGEKRKGVWSVRHLERELYKS